MAMKKKGLPMKDGMKVNAGSKGMKTPKEPMPKAWPPVKRGKKK